MDSRYPYPPGEALQPPGITDNHPQSSFNASRPPYSLNANTANAAPGDNHAYAWNTSLTFPPPQSLSRPENFQSPSMPQLHQLNQNRAMSEPPPPIPGFAPPHGLSTPSGGYPPPSLHPVPRPHSSHGSSLTPSTHHPLPTGFHPPPGRGHTPPTPTGFHPPPAQGFSPSISLHQGPGLPPPPGSHPPSGPGLSLPPPHPPPTGFHPAPGPCIAPPTHQLPPTGFHPPHGHGLTPPTGFYPPPGQGLTPPTGFHPPPGPSIHQPTHHAPATGPHSSPSLSSNLSSGPTPPFNRPNHGPGSGGQLSTQRQVHPKVSGSSSSFFQPQPEDETTIQKRVDDKWVRQFLENKGKLIKPDFTSRATQISVSDMKNTLYSTAQLVFQLSTLCQKLKLNVNNQDVWSDSYEKALKMKQDIQERLKLLTDHDHLERMLKKVSNIAKKRARKRRARQQLEMETQQREEQITEKDVAIERWRMKQIHAEEEKKKEQELKVAADAVLCEVRKKLADVKRMQNILQSLEKLRKLRKEAASRKGISTDPESDKTFNDLLEELRNVAKKRTAVYAAEEKALMVMVEGEQQEERKRDLEKRRQKERDKQLQKKRRVDAMLFGDDTPADPLMQPFRQYYTQAEHSLPVLVQIRREWDIFLVPVDHPEGSSIPQSWVIPDAPSDQAWASALQSSETEDL